MDKKDSKRTLSRIGLIVLLIFILIFAAFQLFLRFYLDDYVESRLLSEVSEQTRGQYELSMSSLDLRVWGREFQIDNLRLSPADSASTAPVIEMDQLKISGIQFLPYIFSGNIYTGQIHFSNPVTTFTQNSPDSPVFLQSNGETSSIDIHSNIEIGRFKIDDGSFIFLNRNQSTNLGELHNLDLEIFGIRLDSSTVNDIPYFKYRSLQTRSGKIRYQLSDLYALESSGLGVTTSINQVYIDSLKLVPQYPKYEFAEIAGHQLDRISLMIGHLLLEKTDIGKLQTGELKAGKFTIQHADLEVFRSRSMPRGPRKEKVFPHVAFKNLSFPISIDTVLIKQSNIIYSEHLADVSMPGRISFEEMNGTIAHVTNISGRPTKEQQSMIMNVTTEVMGKSSLSAKFEFPVNQNGRHTATGTLGSMNVRELNPVLEPMGLVRAESGTIHSLQFLMELDENRADGWVQLIYSDLKIDVLNAENVDDGGKKRLTSWLANMLKIKNDNDEEPYRKGIVAFDRTEKKSIFNYWWKSIASGLQDNIGL